MNDSRRELLQILEELSNRFPNWRFGQMITNLATLARGAEVESIWDAEDPELIDAARQLLENHGAPFQQRDPAAAGGMGSGKRVP